MNDRFAIVSPLPKATFSRVLTTFSSREIPWIASCCEHRNVWLHVFTEANINVVASRTLSDLYRVYQSEYGEDKHDPDDVENPGCPQIFGHEKEVITLIGLGF